MKTRDHIFRVLLLISIYCFGIYTDATSFNQQIAEKQNNQRANLETSSKILYAHTLQFENLFSEVSEGFFLDYKLPNITFWSIAYTNNLLCNTTFKQYTKRLKTISIRHRKSDLIFPFHYFW